MLNLILAMICAVCIDSSAVGSSNVDWSGFDAAIDIALDRAEARADAKLGLKSYTEELDSIILVNREIFTRRHALEIKSLISKARTDAIFNQYPESIRTKMLCDLLAIEIVGGIKAGVKGDTALARLYAEKANYLQGELVDWLVELRAGPNAKRMNHDAGEKE